VIEEARRTRITKRATFCSIRHHIDRCILVLLRVFITDSPYLLSFQKICQFIQGLLNIARFVIKENSSMSWRSSRKSSLVPYGINCLGIMVWTEHDDLLLTKLKAEESFPILLNADLRHRKECLLRREFKYDKNFLGKYNYLSP